VRADAPTARLFCGDLWVTQSAGNLMKAAIMVTEAILRFRLAAIQYCLELEGSGVAQVADHGANVVGVYDETGCAEELFSVL
jgi:hypothetical protein